MMRYILSLSLSRSRFDGWRLTDELSMNRRRMRVHCFSATMTMALAFFPAFQGLSSRTATISRLNRMTLMTSPFAPGVTAKTETSGFGATTHQII